MPSSFTPRVDKKNDLSDPLQRILTAMENRRKRFVSAIIKKPQSNSNTRYSTSHSQEFKIQSNESAMQPKKSCDEQSVTSKVAKLHHSNIVLNPFSNQSRGSLTNKNVNYYLYESLLDAFYK